jgi:hypothetical protein
MSGMAEHRVSMLGASWRRLEDPTRSHDPRVRAVVAALAAVPQPRPRPAFRAELRAQLVAITPRIVAESRDAGPAVAAATLVGRPAAHPKPTAAPAPGRHAGGVLARLPHAAAIPLRRPLGIAVALVVTCAVLLGGAMWMSRGALPGDTLYGLKRAGEQLELATAGGNVDKARDYLDFASARVQEADALLHRANAAGLGPRAGGVDAGTAQLITSTLGSADSDVRSASQLLGQQAVHTKSASPLAVMTSWAPAQQARLRALAAAMPSQPLAARAQRSSDVVSAAAQRAHALAADVGCSCLGASGSDAYGPLPCRTCGTPSTAPGRHSGTPATRSGSGRPASSTAPTGSTAGNAPPAGTGSSTGTNHSGGQQPSPGTPTGTSGLPLPDLPLPTSVPSVPLKAGSCGLTASLGPLGIGLGLCTPGVHLHGQR